MFYKMVLLKIIFVIIINVYNNYTQTNPIELISPTKNNNMYIINHAICLNCNRAKRIKCSIYIENDSLLIKDNYYKKLHFGIYQDILAGYIRYENNRLFF